jgi:hypothetical protein
MKVTSNREELYLINAVKNKNQNPIPAQIIISIMPLK